MTKYKDTSKAKDVKIYKVDIVAQEELATKYKIRGLPVLVYFQDGKITGKELGIRSVEKLKELEKRYFK